MRPWDEARWQRHVCAVAREAVYQKFSKARGPPHRADLAAHLLGTGKRRHGPVLSHD